MTFLIDMNLSPIWSSFFARNGFTGIHWSSVGPPNASDAAIMEYASTNGFVVFTHDLDFGMLLALTQGRGPSVVQIRTQDVLPDSIGPLVLRALTSARLRLEEGALVTIDAGRNRVRMLPI